MKGIHIALEIKCYKVESTKGIHLIDQISKQVLNNYTDMIDKEFEWVHVWRNIFEYEQKTSSIYFKFKESRKKTNNICTCMQQKTPQ